MLLDNQEEEFLVEILDLEFMMFLVEDMEEDIMEELEDKLMEAMEVQEEEQLDKMLRMEELLLIPWKEMMEEQPVVEEEQVEEEQVEQVEIQLAELEPMVELLLLL
jgi:hypothetical protein